MHICLFKTDIWLMFWLFSFRMFHNKNRKVLTFKFIKIMATLVLHRNFYVVRINNEMSIYFFLKSVILKLF